MFKRIQINKHKLTFARPSVFSFPAACLSVCPSISVCLCIFLPRDIYLPICLSFLFVSISISVWSLFVCLSVCASICVCLFIYLSVCLSVYLSVCLSVCCLSVCLCLELLFFSSQSSPETMRGSINVPWLSR